MRRGGGGIPPLHQPRSASPSLPSGGHASSAEPAAAVLPGRALQPFPLQASLRLAVPPLLPAQSACARHRPSCSGTATGLRPGPGTWPLCESCSIARGGSPNSCRSLLCTWRRRSSSKVRAPNLTVLCCHFLVSCTAALRRHALPAAPPHPAYAHTPLAVPRPAACTLLRPAVPCGSNRVGSGIYNPDTLLGGLHAQP
jgi:hypothetical protein